MPTGRDIVIGSLTVLTLAYINIKRSNDDAANNYHPNENTIFAKSASSAGSENSGLENTADDSYASYSDKTSSLDELFSHDQSPKIYLNSRHLSRQLLDDMVDKVFDKLDPPKLITKQYVLSDAAVESTNDPFSISYKGAKGLMNIMRAAWNQVETQYDYDTYVFDPQINMFVGVKYMIYLDGFLRDNYYGYDNLDVRSKRDLISAAWNAGPNGLKDSGWRIYNLSFETINHVMKVNNLMYGSREIYYRD